MRVTSRWTFPLAGLVALVAATMLAGCGGGGGDVAANNEVFPVETATAAYEVVAPALTYSGSVAPVRKSFLGAQIQGPIEKFHVDAGDAVKEGDLLVELASEQLTQTEAQYVAAGKDWERMQVLFDKGAITEQAFDQAEAGYEAARAAYEMILESTRIRAPFDGIVTERYYDEGEVFTLMPVSTPTPAILELADIDKVKIEIEIGERERPLAGTGLEALVTVSSVGGEPLKGTVSRIDPGLDRMTRTSTADIVLDNPNHKLRPGMFADVRLTLASRTALLIPREAVVRQEGTGSFFAYAVADGKAVRHDLTLGEGFGDRIEVREGLSDGATVVTAGRYKLHDGAPVRVQNGGDVAPDGGVGEPSAPEGFEREGGR